jgi:hypothetical protein
VSAAVAHEPHTPWGRIVIAGIGLAVVLSVLVLAFLWPTVTASVKNLPIAVVGDAATTSQLESALEQKAPGVFDFRGADDRAAAAQLIETRDAYGAIVLGPSPEVLVSTASSPVAAQLLSGLAPALQAQLNAAAAAQGIRLPSPIVVTVTDVAPLASTDPRGTALAASSFPLVLGGMIGGLAISIAVVGVWRRVTAVLVYSVVGGLALTGIMQGFFGALQGSYLLNSAAVALALLSVSAVIVGFVSLFGRVGIAVGPILYLLIANPISSAAQPYQFLAEPWGAVGQWFPPGAAATLLRELSYFPKADTTFPWLVLAAWAVGGLLFALLGHFRNTGAATRAALAEAEAASWVIPNRPDL